MSKLIIEGSQMQCTLGTKPSKITVTSQTFVKLKDKLIATEEDKQANSNIEPIANAVRINPLVYPCPLNGNKPPKKIRSTE